MRDYLTFKDLGLNFGTTAYMSQGRTINEPFNINEIGKNEFRRIYIQIYQGHVD